MNDSFIISDTHFGHQGACEFTVEGGAKMRPWDNIEEMDEAMVENWNKTVGPKDKIYHLGDVVINRRHLKTLARLNGRKILIRGNHDIFRTSEYLPYFEEIYGSYKLDNFILTHIPIHPKSLARWAKGNIHGHLHTYRVKHEDGTIDTRYKCVSVEQINYTPIKFHELMEIIKKEQS